MRRLLCKTLPFLFALCQGGSEVHWMGEGTVKLDVGMSRTDRLYFLRGLETQGRPVVENLVLK